MSEETKTPKTGEYWIDECGSIIRIVGTKLNGSVIYENRAGFSFQFNSMIQWRHEPRCTGFDWTEPPAINPGEGWELLPVGTVLRDGDQFEAIGKWRNTNNAGRKKLPGWTYRRKIKPVETWPKYYVHKHDSFTWHVKRTAKEAATCIYPDGLITGGAWTELNDKFVADGDWKEITEAEALARVKPDTSRPTNIHGTANDADETPEPCAMCGDVSCDCDCYKYAVEATGCPVESPDDWVEITNRDHKLRAGIDEFRNSHEWAYVRDSHGKTARQAGFLNVRCRRKDLPPVESPYDWVEITDPGHVVRSYIDQVLVSAFGGHRWEYAVMSVGSCLSDLGVSRCRCRRKHLPVPMTLQSVAEVCTSEPVKTPDVVTWGGTVPSAKRVPVRLWINGDDGVVFQSEVHVNADDQEIKHDADGFYVTEEE